MVGMGHKDFTKKIEQHRFKRVKEIGFHLLIG
jgi:hypothetical protein